MMYSVLCTHVYEYTCVVYFKVELEFVKNFEIALKERTMLRKDQYTLHTWAQLPENCAQVS